MKERTCYCQEALLLPVGTLCISTTTGKQEACKKISQSCETNFSMVIACEMFELKKRMQNSFSLISSDTEE